MCSLVTLTTIRGHQSCFCGSGQKVRETMVMVVALMMEVRMMSQYDNNPAGAKEGDARAEGAWTSAHARHILGVVARPK